ncbi:MAG: hypothetical protein AAGF55_06600, partial [Pseudomonadota bacterium]
VATSELHLTLKRTGLPQTIHGYKGGKIDLSDWQKLGEIEIVQSGADTVLSSTSEYVVFRETSAENVRTQIIGAVVGT